MSYSIYYDRAFVRIGDKYIPLVNSGSNNCYEYKGSREVPEKNWGILNWKRETQVFFTEAEIREIAKDYDQYNQESWMLYKSRYRLFEPGEFERWVIHGMKRAYTIEEYHSFGNRLYILDYTPKTMTEWTEHPFSTADELLDILSQIGDERKIDIHMYNNREVYRPVKHRARGRGLRVGDLPEYYVLAGKSGNSTTDEQVIYFVKLTRTGLRYSHYNQSWILKVFRTEREASLYIEKYADRLSPYAIFRPEKVTAPVNRNESASA